MSKSPYKSSSAISPRAGVVRVYSSSVCTSTNFCLFPRFKFDRIYSEQCFRRNIIGIPAGLSESIPIRYRPTSDSSSCRGQTTAAVAATFLDVGCCQLFLPDSLWSLRSPTGEPPPYTYYVCNPLALGARTVLLAGIDAKPQRKSKKSCLMTLFFTFQSPRQTAKDDDV